MGEIFQKFWKMSKVNFAKKIVLLHVVFMVFHICPKFWFLTHVVSHVIRNFINKVLRHKFFLCRNPRLLFLWNSSSHAYMYLHKKYVGNKIVTTCGHYLTLDKVYWWRFVTEWNQKISAKLQNLTPSR